MKRITAVIVITVIISVFLCSCSLFSEPEGNEAPEVDITSYLTEDEWTEMVGSNSVEQTEGVTTNTIMEWTESYTIYASYPSLDNYEEASADIEDFVMTKITYFKEEMAQNGDTRFETKPEFTMTYSPYRYGDSTVSFKMVTYTDCGVTRTVNYIDTFRYDLGNGESIELDDLFVEDADYLGKISTIVKEQLKNNDSLSDYYDEERFNNGLEPVDSNYSQFIIGDTALTFFFNQGQIANPLAGSFSADVEYADLADILTDNFLKGGSLSAVSEAAPSVDLPEYLQTDETEMSAYSIDGIDPINDKVVAITFDDGPAVDKTLKIVEAFQAVGGKCTFFEVGENVESHPEITKAVYEAGMEIGMHSYDHPNYYKMSYEEMVADLDKVGGLIADATGKYPIIFRAPYGNVTAEAAEKYGRQSIYWTVDTLDWKNKDVQMNYENAVNDCYDGAIILMHDIHQTTVDSVPKIVNRLDELGYKFVTITQLDQILIARGQDPTWRLGRDASTAKPKDLTSETAETADSADAAQTATES